MRAERRPIVSALLSAALCAGVAGCAAMAGGLPTLADLDLADQYSSPSASPIDPAGLERCWAWLNDPLLAELVDGPGEAAEGGALSSAAKAQIAQRYMTLRARQARIGNARDYIAVQLDNQEIARFREEAELVTARDAVQADAERALVAATIPGLEAENAADAARIAVLSGRAPAALRDRLSPTAPIPVEPAEIAVGAPSDLLNRRPDLREAAARLKAAGPLGGPSSKVRAAYRLAILAALEDVENAQASSEGAAARARSLAAAAEKAEALAELARRQYREGEADYGALSAAEAALLDTRDALADARAARASASIDLCVALGGGSSAPPAGG